MSYFKNNDEQFKTGDEWNMQDEHLRTLAAAMRRVVEALSDKEPAEQYYSLLALKAYAAVNIKRAKVDAEQIFKDINEYGSTIKGLMPNDKAYNVNKLAFTQRIATLFQELMYKVDEANVIYPKKELKTITEVVTEDF